MSDENTMGSHGDSANDPLSELLRQLGFTVPDGGMDLNAMMAQFQRMMSQYSGQADPQTGINWDMTRQAARQVVAKIGPDPTPSQKQRVELADADRLAESWLNPVTTFPAVSAPAQAWSRAQWVEDTMDSWRTVVEPIVTSIAQATAGTLANPGEHEAPELAALTGMFAPMMRQAAGQMYAAQLAQAIGQIAAEVVTGAELGLQLLSSPRVIFLPANADAFIKGLELPDEDARMYLVVREAARQRLFSSVTWLAPQMLALIEHYAREITIDTSALTDAIDMDSLNDLNPQKLQEISEQLQGRLFKPTRTAEQEEILDRLGTLLALIEGWVDAVAHQACSQWIPREPALMEAVRRRHATGGPAEKVAGALVGLELQPRKEREAFSLWQAILSDRGIDGRDQVWSHPDLIPTTADLDDPIGFVQGERRESEQDWDADLARLLAEDDAEAGSDSGADSDGPTSSDADNGDPHNGGPDQPEDPSQH